MRREETEEVKEHVRWVFEVMVQMTVSGWGSSL
jgi:hypothetical protein